MSESILISTKKLLGIAEDDPSFDVDVIMHINSVLADLVQLGVGSDHGTMITDDSTTWEDFLGTDLNLNNVKTYMYLRVKQVFDPPTTGFGLEAIKSMIDKAEFRINVHMEGETWVPPVVIPTLESSEPVL